MKRKPTKQTKRNPPPRRVSRIKGPKKNGTLRRSDRTARKPVRRAVRAGVQSSARRPTKRGTPKAATRKPKTRRTRKQVGKQASLRKKLTKVQRQNRKLLQEVRRLQALETERTRQPPSKFPTPSEFARARKRELKRRREDIKHAESEGGSVTYAPLADYEKTAHNYSRNVAREFEDELEDFTSTGYDDMFDYDYDDIYDDIGDEEEDGYGEDAK